MWAYGKDVFQVTDVETPLRGVDNDHRSWMIGSIKKMDLDSSIGKIY